MALFGELDYRLSVVDRWSVLSTIRKQSVAEHSYNVAIIAERLALKLFPNGYHPSRAYPITGEVLHLALHHDRPESITGDNPSYMKPYVDESGALAKIPAAQADDDMNFATDDPWVKFIVKCADYIDALVFLRIEMSLGNKSVAYHLRHMEHRFREYVGKQVSVLGPTVSDVVGWYNKDINDTLFGGVGQYVSEIDGFPRTP